MSAHHAFGARTWRAPALIGAALTTLALLFSQDLTLILRAFPLAILAALLLVAGITHAQLLSDVRGRFDWAAALAIGVAGATGHLLAAVVIGLAVVAAHSKLRAGRPATDT